MCVYMHTHTYIARAHGTCMGVLSAYIYEATQMYGLGDHKGTSWRVYSASKVKFTGRAAMKALCMVESLSSCVYMVYQDHFRIYISQYNA